MKETKNSDEISSAMKFVWAYMLKEGYLTEGGWSYYGSGWGYPTVPSKYDKNVRAEIDWREERVLKESLLKKVKEVGVDWEKTKSPQSSQESCFNGTFAETTKCEALLGTLFLKDGSSYMLGVNRGEEKFSNYIKFLNSFMEDKGNFLDILGEDT